MSTPDGPDATRRTLIRGAVVLGVVGVGAGLSRLGEGTYELASNTGAETDIAAQAPAPEATAAAEPAEPAASAKPAKSSKPAKEPKSTDSTESAKPSKSGQTESAAKKPTSAKKTETADEPEATKKTKPAKEPKEPKPAGKALGPSSKVPVGGGTIYKADRVVVTQPSKGVFKAFDAMCTHANCLVGEVKAGAIHCPCHNAKFGLADGAVIKPSVARRPLNPKTVTESGGTIYLT